MADNRNIEWTDALRVRFIDAELTPSDSLWQRLVEDAAVAVCPGKTSRRIPVAWLSLAAIACGIATLFLLRPSILPERGTMNDIVEETGVPEIAEATPVLDEEPVLQIQPESVFSSPLLAEAFVADGKTELEPQKEVMQVTEINETHTLPDTSVDSLCETVDSIETDELDDVRLYDFVFDSIHDRKKTVRLAVTSSGFPIGIGAFGYSSHLDSGPNPVRGNIPSFIGLPIHHRPYKLELNITYPLEERFYVESGLSLTILSSEYPDEQVTQNVLFAGIPLRMGYHLNTGSRMRVGATAGVMAEKCLFGVADGTRFTLDGIQVSAMAGVSLEYRLGDHIGIFIRPEWSYYFTDTKVPTFRTEHPSSFNVSVGINKSIFFK